MRSTPWVTAYVLYGPPQVAQEPIAITHLGSGIWSYRRLTMGAIFSTTVPATIIRSDCRGVPRQTSAPNRERSCRASMTAIISMAQQARPNCMGQIDERRAQLITESTVVVTTLSSNRLSIKPMRAALPCGSSPVQGFPLPAVNVPDDQDR